ncbi:hypothetical protein LSTR_LSTR013064 [Laodelphax striatellus]|uniref:Aquaporin n=1 Tax=Laodelphax striatellus TaxID=195883 RepID=A0A482WQ68_LAOST|nr:hypothetical protein LSTR_LSTR013064 [Laodelphax striatellus]
MSQTSLSRGNYKPITEYVTTLRGEEFQDMDVDKVWRIVRVALAECFGTAMFVAIGCSSLVAFPDAPANNALHTVLAFAFAVTLSITTFGHISGSFINPSLALSALIVGKISLPMFVVYTLSECLGAYMGLSALKAISPEGSIGEGFCLSVPSASLTVSQVLSAEALLTFCLCMLFCSIIDPANNDKQDSVPLKFGASVIALAVAGGKYTGCSMNPARSFGPALQAGIWSNHWVYWLGPLTGALFAGLFHRMILRENPHQKKPTQATKFSETAEA